MRTLSCWGPYYRLREAGVEVAVGSLSRGAIKGKHGYEVTVDKILDEVTPDDYTSDWYRFSCS